MKKNNTWLRPKINGSAPLARCAHATTVLNNQMYIFGGWSGMSSMNDLHILQNVDDSFSWISPTIEKPLPVCRAGHCAAGLNGKIFVFGGGDGVNNLSQLDVFDCEKTSWLQAFASGNAPEARSRHTAISQGKDMFIFGGGDEKRVFNDLHKFDSVQMSWSMCPTSGDMPSARWGHSANLIGNKMYVFGGNTGSQMLSDLYVVDLETFVWSFVPTTGHQPTPRAGHGVLVYKNRYLVLFGGGDGEHVLNDLFIFDTEKRTWRCPRVTGVPPGGRCAHTISNIGENLVVFGGSNGERNFKDIYVLDLDSTINAATLPAPSEQPLTASLPRKNPYTTLDPQANAADTLLALLRIHGLQKYHETFVRRGYSTIQQLARLTESELEEMGVSPSVVRRQVISVASQNARRPRMRSRSNSAAQQNQYKTQVREEEKQRTEELKVLRDVTGTLLQSVSLLNENVATLNMRLSQIEPVLAQLVAAQPSPAPAPATTTTLTTPLNSPTLSADKLASALLPALVNFQTASAEINSIVQGISNLNVENNKELEREH